jgi:hypothetical protein
MSTPTIDYDALARQAGAVNVPPPVSTPQATAPPSAPPKTTNAAVDYDALARQAGAVDVQPLKPATTPTQTSFRENVAQGVGTAAAQSLSGIAEVGSHIPGTQYVASKVGDVLGLPKLPANTNPYETVNKSTAANATAANQTTGGKVGTMGENLAEFVLGDEALKGLSLARRAGLLSKLAQVAETHPIIAKIIGHGLDAVRTGVVGTAQGLAHGESLPQAATSGAIAGATGAALGTATDGIRAIAPYVKEIAGESIPVRASQESGLANAAENVAPTKALSKFDVENTQPAAKRAIGNVASQVRDAALEDDFKDWFGKSKIVDENGKPLRVYHGTRSSAEFKDFSTEGRPMVEGEYGEGEYATSGSGADPTSYMGAHFAGEPQVANKFASGSDWMKSRYEAGEVKPRVIPTYLSIENPKNFGPESNLRNFIYEGKLAGYEGDELLNRAMEADDVDPESEEAEGWMSKYDSDPKFRAEQNQWLFESHRPAEGEDEMLDSAAQDLAQDAKSRLKQMGHDGAIYKNEVEGGTGYIAFDSNQIKPSISTPGPKALPKVANLQEAAGDLKAQSKPVFEKLDDLTKDQEMTFSDWQKQESGAFRRGDIEAAKKAKAAQAAILDQFKDQFDPKDLQNAKTNWRQASALQDIHDALNAKGVVGPTPVELRPKGADLGYINGKAFLKQILAMSKDGTLARAGLTPEHIQSLQDLGTLLEKSANVHKFGQLAKLTELGGAGLTAVLHPVAAVAGAKVAVPAYLAQKALGRAMTNPETAETFVNLLRGAGVVAPAIAAQVTNEVQK